MSDEKVNIKAEAEWLEGIGAPKHVIDLIQRLREKIVDQKSLIAELVAIDSKRRAKLLEPEWFELGGEYPVHPLVSGPTVLPGEIKFVPDELVPAGELHWVLNNKVIGKIVLEKP